MPTKGEYVKLKNYERKIKSPFIIYADFESILVPENTEKQNPEESYTNRQQKLLLDVVDINVVFVDDKFSKPFKEYLGEDLVKYFINSMIEENKYCSGVMKKNLTKNLQSLKKTMRILRILINVGFVAMIMMIMMLK